MIKSQTYDSEAALIVIEAKYAMSLNIVPKKKYDMYVFAITGKTILKLLVPFVEASINTILIKAVNVDHKMMHQLNRDFDSSH